jgi:hypothetical protein
MGLILVIPMQTFQRNRIEGALHAVMRGPLREVRDNVDGEIPQHHKTLVKRLLELDLKGENPGAAFFDELPGGTGSEVRYTLYNVVRLAIAIQFTKFGIKQSEAVAKVAAIRRDIEKAFDRAPVRYETDGKQSFTVSGPNPPMRELVLGKGETPDPSIFLIITTFDREDARQGRPASKSITEVEICYGEKELPWRLRRIFTDETRSALVMNIADLKARLNEALEAQPVRRRGRQ